jgi:hypothetical protein
VNIGLTLGTFVLTARYGEHMVFSEPQERASNVIGYHGWLSIPPFAFWVPPLICSYGRNVHVPPVYKVFHLRRLGTLHPFMEDTGNL